MLTLGYLQSRPDRCHGIPPVRAVAASGWYPTESCVRFDAGERLFTVSLEGFSWRQRSPPEPVPES